MSKECETCNGLWEEFARKTEALSKLIETRYADRHKPEVRAAIDAAIEERQRARRAVLVHEQECPRREPEAEE